jgi:carotenoid cleavage dioxygenase
MSIREGAGSVAQHPEEDPMSEDDGWLLTITTRTDRPASQLLVLDASDVTRRVAAVTLPRGVPAGFHGSWVGA